MQCNYGDALCVHQEEDEWTMNGTYYHFNHMQNVVCRMYSNCCCKLCAPCPHSSASPNYSLCKISVPPFGQGNAFICTEHNLQSTNTNQNSCSMNNASPYCECSKIIRVVPRERWRSGEEWVTIHEYCVALQNTLNTHEYMKVFKFASLSSKSQHHWNHSHSVQISVAN